MLSSSRMLVLSLAPLLLVLLLVLLLALESQVSVHAGRARPRARAHSPTSVCTDAMIWLSDPQDCHEMTLSRCSTTLLCAGSHADKSATFFFR
eukprot:scaffold4416_cov65-Phaeocystis_antarctica.AAC.2